MVEPTGGGTFPFGRPVRAITEMRDGRKLRPDASYGVEQPLTTGGRKTQWIALCAPDPPPVYAEVHARWRELRRG
jgi:hypothetical protein